MNHLKKILFGLAVAVTLVLVGANSASAQSCTTASSPTNVRSEGTIEVLGQITLTCTGATAGQPATITVAIAPSTATVAPSVVGGACGVIGTGDNKSTFPLPLITDSLGFAPGGPPATGCSVSGNTASFSFTPAAAGPQTIVISGIRANIAASGLTAGAAVVASLTVSPTVAGQLSITNPTLTIAFANSSTFTFGTVFNIASCGPVVPPPAGSPAITFGNPDNVNVNSPANSVKVTLTEGFATAWQTAAAEDGGSLFGIGTRFRIQLTGIPTTGFLVYAPDQISAASLATTGGVSPVVPPSALVLNRVAGATLAADGSGGAMVPGVANQYDKITPVGGTATVVYEVAATDPVAVVNSALIYIAITGVAPTSTGTISGSVGYAPVGPPTAVGARPQFVAGTAKTVATVNVCATYLLFPWVATDGRGSLDTGFAISNTTADPSVIGTVAQSGTVTLYFFPSAGGTAPAPVTLNSGASLPAGQTATYVLSTGLGGTTSFSGYVIAVCGFQYGHGFAYINGPYSSPTAWAEGYLALSITNPRASFTAAGVTESAGH